MNRHLLTKFGVARISMCHFGTLPERQAQSISVQKYANRRKKIRNDRVYGWGLTASGALGVSEFVTPIHHPSPKRKAYKPCRVEFADKHKVTSISSGYGFSLFAIKTRDTIKVYGAGLNTSGQLGFHPCNDDINKTRQWLITPEPIELPFRDPINTKIFDVSCGRSHSLIATSEGLFTVGSNAQGQCGRPIICDQDYTASSTVHKVIDLPKVSIRQVVAGLDHSLVLTEDNQVYSFGLGADGQLGNGKYDSCWMPQLVKGDIEGEEIVQLSSSADTVLAVSDKGDLFGWGNSEYKQLLTDEPQRNIPKHLTFNMGKVLSAAAGGSACALISDSGQVYVWGYGLLGQGPEVIIKSIPSLIPMPIFGRNEVMDVQVELIEAGLTHFAAVNSNGDLFMWGKNRFGLLGLGHEKEQYFPFRVSILGCVKRISCGPDHTLAITSDMI